MRAFPLVLLALCAAGCRVPIAGALDDREANRVVVALEQSSVDASREPDPASEGKWRVEVERDELPRALAILRDEDLPRTDPPGVLEALGKGSLVPSEAAEHAQLVTGISGDLERSLEGVDGVLRARVHLSVPELGPLREGAAPPRETASVLLEYRGSTPPLSADAVQRLVSGGVAGLLATDVNVVLVSHVAPALPGEGGIGHVGPIAVTRASLRSLQAGLVALVGLLAILAAATLLLYTRLARARAELAAQQPPTGRGA